MGPIINNSIFQIGFWVLIGFVFGIILALFISGFTKRSRSRRDRPTELGTKGHYQEIVRLWRDPGSGKIVTELRGKTFTDTNSLSPKEYEYLARNSRDWAAWLGISIAAATREAAKPVETTPVKNVPASQPAGEKQGAAVPQPASDAVQPSSTGESVPQASLNVVPAEMSPEPLPPVLMESLAVEETGPSIPAAVIVASSPLFSPQVAPMTVAAARSKTPAAPLSILEQVDQILQEKLAQLPPPAPVVLLKEDPRGGVIVWINGVQHNGIDSVRDESIKSLIRASVKEWERRNEHK